MTDVSEVDVHQATALIANGAVLLDVREPEEWAAGHAPDAVHVPLGALSPATVPEGRLVVICHVGGRSAYATAVLCANGYDAVNVAGGMAAWEAAGLPVTT
jgi:rhodanese-related sulfurtransferase